MPTQTNVYLNHVGEGADQEGNAENAAEEDVDAYAEEAEDEVE